MTAGTIYRIKKLYIPALEKCSPFFSTSSTIHFGPTTHPIRMLVKKEMIGIRKLLLI